MTEGASSGDRPGPGPLGVGVGFGLAHTVSETAVLGALGLGLGWRDVLVLTVVQAAAGAALGLLLGLVLGAMVRSAARGRALQSLLTGGLLLALALDLGGGNSAAGRWALAIAVVALLSLGLAEARRRLSPWTRALAQCAVALPAVSSTVLITAPKLGLLTAHSESGLRTGLLGGAAVLAVAAGLLAWLRGVPRDGPGRLSRLALALIPTLLYLGPLPRPLRLHVRETASPAEARPDGPDVLFVVLDTVRADHLDLFGAQRPTMPRLSRFAREECAVAQVSLATAPSSLPSHASMFTGLYSTHHGAHKPFLIDPAPPAYAYSIRRDAPVLAERLAAAGYDTAGIAANFGVLGSFGLDRGFAHYDVAPGPAYLGARLVWLSRWRFLGRKPGGMADRLLPQTFARRTVLFTDRVPDYRRAAEINDQARDWLDSRGQRPFFLFLNYFDAHDPYLPEPAFDGHFRDEPADIEWVGFPKRGYGAFLRGERQPRAIDLEWMRAQYDAELLSLDVRLDEMFQALKDRGRWDETLVVVVSDHGEGFWEHGFLRHSTTLYQDQVGIPLLIKLPRSQEAPERVSEHLQLIDLMPTLLHQLGLPLPELLDGTAWAEGRDASLAEVFCHHPEELHLMREMTAVVQGDHKYIHVFDGTELGREELYDLRRDPQEIDDLLARDEPPPELEDLRARARALIEQRGAALERQLQEGGEAADEEMLQRLRELGYLPEKEG